MDKPRRIGCQTEHEDFVDYVNELVDDSLKFIDEEMSRIGINPEVAKTVKDRIAYGVISRWADDAFTYWDSQEDGPYVGEERIVPYLNNKFGLDLEVPSPLLLRLK